jgi:hypothetical protein
MVSALKVRLNPEAARTMRAVDHVTSRANALATRLGV